MQHAFSLASWHGHHWHVYRWTHVTKHVPRYAHGMCIHASGLWHVSWHMVWLVLKSHRGHFLLWFHSVIPATTTPNLPFWQLRSMRHATTTFFLRWWSMLRMQGQTCSSQIKARSYPAVPLSRSHIPLVVPLMLPSLYPCPVPVSLCAHLHPCALSVPLGSIRKITSKNHPRKSFDEWFNWLIDNLNLLFIFFSDTE